MADQGVSSSTGPTKLGSEQAGHGSQVAQHYNNLQETGLAERAKSRIFYQRNFNNWLKSQCIGEALEKIKQERGRSNITVLDLGSGKGGDILKWKKGDVSHVSFADIAGTSVEQCESRYKEMRDRAQNDRRFPGAFTAEFITADCTKERLKEKYKDPNIKFDLVSCQFAFHYCFESYEQAVMMTRNACECLKPGGYFIGTTPDSFELVKRLKASEDLSFGNEVYNIKFESKEQALFGAKYDFHLEGVVDCPEFLVYFPAVEKIAAEFGMKLIKRVPFAQYFEQQIKTRDGRGLIGKMQALEPYPADRDVELVSSKADDYKHAAEFMEKLAGEQNPEEDDHRGDHRRPKKVGTLTQAEWEATTIYCYFVFQKMTDEDSERSRRKRPVENAESEASEPKKSKDEAEAPDPEEVPENS